MAHDDQPTGAPYLPSVESKCYLHGLPSRPRMLARSNAEVWNPPTGPEAYLERKELAVLGAHRLDGVWEDTVGPAIATYLAKHHVQWSIMHPVRLAVVGRAAGPPPAFVMIGVDPDTVSAESGLRLAVHCRSILLDHQIEDVHVIVYESQYRLLAGLYKPALTSNPVAIAREPFSTTLGIPICNAATPDIEGTGGFFFVDATKPGKLFLLTARHVLFHPDREPNTLYCFDEGAGSTKRKVLLMGNEAFKARCRDIEAAIGDKAIVLELLARRLKLADTLDGEDAGHERNQVEALTTAADEAIEALKKLLTDIRRDWTDEENRVIGHVTLSPPISFNHVDGGFTEDWAVVELLPSMISKLNLVGNAIDLGSVAVEELTAWMSPQLSTPGRFRYPGDRLLRFTSTVSDDEMYKRDPMTKGQDNDPAIMVLKNGNATNLTVGRLNTIRAFTRTCKGQLGGMSKEIAVLPRSSKSDPFAGKGDSGSGVVDANGRVCGLVTGGDGAADASDCTFITSVNFLVKRLEEHGIRPNIFPVPAEM